jgi:hypothetical protein
VLTVQHADAPRLRQQVAGQAQLPGQRRVTPQQAEERRPRLSQALLGLHPADPQGQRRRACGFAQAPLQRRAVQQHQARIAFQLFRARQFAHGLEMHMVVRAALRQGGDEAADARLVVGTHQQDFAGRQRTQWQDAQQQQAQQHDHQNASSALTLRRWRLS